MTETHQFNIQWFKMCKTVKTDSVCLQGAKSKFDLYTKCDELYLFNVKRRVSGFSSTYLPTYLPTCMRLSYSPFIHYHLPEPVR